MKTQQEHEACLRDTFILSYYLQITYLIQKKYYLKTSSKSSIAACF